MERFLAILRMVARRSLANRRLLTTVVVGVVLSAALMSTVILYSDAIRDLGLQHALHNEDPLSLDIFVVSSSQPARKDDYVQRREKTAALLRTYAGDILDKTSRYGRTATFFLTPPGAPVPKDERRPRANFQFFEGLNDHVQVVDGRAPKPAEPLRDTKSPPRLEVSLGKAAADQLGVKTGDSFELHPFWKPDVAPVAVTVVGLIEPKNPDEDYWFRKQGRFVETTTSWPTYLFFVGEEAFTDSLAAYLPDMDGTFETYGFIDIDSINSRNAKDVEGRVGGLEVALREQIVRTSMETALPKTIAAYRTKLFFTRLPLFALMLQVVGIVLYYLVMVATMLVERQTGEIALLKSRGASTLQIMAVYGIEGGVLCGAAALLGPFVAAGAIALLGLTPPFQDLSGGGLLDVPLSRQAVGMAALGSGLALLALLWPAYRAAKNTMIDYKHQLARPQQQPMFLRYYLDLVLLAAGAFAFYELRQRGSLVTERLFGDLSADPLLLVSPTLFMLMIALVFLRLFPVALRVVAWAARGLNGPTVALGLWRMVRSPLHYSRLILLLLLATAVGMFAAGFRATLERSYDDRAGYEAGANSRLESIRTPANQPNATFVSLVQRATDASEVTPVARLNASYNVTQFRSEDIAVLGVNPGELERVVFWRDDFASSSLHSLLSRLKPSESPAVTGVEVPAGSRFIGLWAQFPLSQNVAQLGIRLRDPNDVFWEYRLTPNGPPSPGTWQFFVADLARPQQQRFGTGANLTLALPKQLDSVYVRTAGQQPTVAERVAVLVDDLQVSSDPTLPADWPNTGLPSGTIIEKFEDVDRYEPITGAALNADAGAVSRAEVAGRTGGFAARIAFTRLRGAPLVVGLRVRGSFDTLPVIASQSFLDATKKKTGDEFSIYVNRQYVKVRIAGSFDLFPSFKPAERRHLFVADLSALQAIGGRVPYLADGIYANEAWMDGVPPGRMSKESMAAKGITADGIFDRSALRAQQASDPLVAASWEGILFLSFTAVLALTALGFAVYATLAAQARALEFAILRTMGYSSRQILSLVTFEQLFVIVAGVVVGTLLGFPLSRLMISYLGVTESGKDPLPPLISQVSWGAVVTVYSLLALVFVGTIASLAAVYSRLAVHRALRIGEV